MNPSANKERILIVDDMPTNIQSLIETLHEHYTLMAANNGPKAIQLATSDTPPDLILLDIVMPDMDGYEIIEQLKTHPNTQHIPVIFVTSKDEVMDEARGFALGAADYITKPISPLIVQARAKAHIELYKKNRELEKTVKILERKLALIKPPSTAKTHAKEHPEDDIKEHPEEYFLDDHRSDMKELSEEIDATINLMLLQKKIDFELMGKAGRLFERYAGILSLYPVFGRLGGGLQDFANQLQSDQYDPTEENIRFALGCLESLLYTLRHWSEQIFNNQLENPHIFDNSMLSDMDTILQALENKMEDTTGQIEFF